MSLVFPVLGAGLCGFGLGAWLARTTAGIDWLQIAGVGTLATLAALLAMTLTSAAGPIWWIPRFHLLVDNGYSLPALASGYLGQVLALCSLPLVFPVLGFALIRGSWMPLLEALVLVPTVAAAAVASDLLDGYRQQNPDGSADGGLGGALLMLLAMVLATTVWILPWPLSPVLALMLMLGLLATSWRLIQRRTGPRPSMPQDRSRTAFEFSTPSTKKRT
ncbi:hypothetical protein OK351_07445 [Glutamicibacter sp. MNS18]|uniref:hypothetical protein n=1 Tax=Glutamicibacter sp. MNS18 TaxID=2989817 RepID=UPI002235DAC6|nr:hypothetical protein [Glutamicibacter sp. MNS18]MCW4465333.1 hypothetical protein [Glutamicibacter sp. MNS18]